LVELAIWSNGRDHADFERVLPKYRPNEARERPLGADVERLS